MKNLLAVMLLLSAASIARAQGSGHHYVNTGLLPGDVVEVTVWQRPELSGEIVVAADGSLLHPLYRQVTVTNVPVEQVRGRLERFLTTLEANPQFVVQPLFRVAVLGMVGQPDIYRLPPGTTVREAVAGAGGVSLDGRADEVQLVRNGSSMQIDLTEPGSTGANMPVRSGDQIMVEPRGGGAFKAVLLPIVGVIGSIASIVNIATR